MAEKAGLSAVKQVFQPLYEKELSDKDAFEINQNLLGFFELLIKLEREQKKNEKSN